MTDRDEIIRMAREAGAVTGVKDHLNVDGDSIVFVPEELEAFAALVAAAEREACAKALDAIAEVIPTASHETFVYKTVTECAAAIRARGQT